MDLRGGAHRRHQPAAAGVLPAVRHRGTGRHGPNYGKEIIFLFLGGFLLALGIERSGLHRRIALWTVLKLGGSPARLVLGIMVASALLSMWINSTATVLVMLPIALSLVDGLDEDHGRERLAVPLLLGVSYGASMAAWPHRWAHRPTWCCCSCGRSCSPAVRASAFGQWMSFGIPSPSCSWAFPGGCSCAGWNR